MTPTLLKTTAVLVGIQLPQISDQEQQSSLDELSRLVTTMGARVIGQLNQRRTSDRNQSVLGEGKLKELATWTGGTGIIGPGIVKKKHKAALKFEDNHEVEEPEPQEAESSDKAPDELAQIVVFDCDLSPSQLRNLERATGVKVYDRTGVIIEIFSRHARTKAAKLQVEIARLAYLAPRIRETGAQEDRQEGGGGKGSGETSLELDKRNIRDRIKELKQELAAMADEQVHRRHRRDQELTVALVGYTNAGKSSLMRALTGSEVLVADKLFATLDTTVRALYPPTVPKILVSDTVGFIKKLPHDLVASFKSTLDEALSSSLLLYVVDASDPIFRSQLEVSQKVLAEVGAQEIESRLVLNKIDRLSTDELDNLKGEFPNAFYISTINPQDIARLRLNLIEIFESDMITDILFVPYNLPGAIGMIRDCMQVIEESFDENGTTFKIRAYQEDIERFKAKFKKSLSEK